MPPREHGRPSAVPSVYLEPKGASVVNQGQFAFRIRPKKRGQFLAGRSEVDVAKHLC
jgi:hypothetical protein